MTRETKALIDEVSGFLKDEGYQVLNTLFGDYDRTARLVVEKDGKERIFPLIECFYETDSEGKMIAFPGVRDIRETLWYKYKKRKAEVVV